MPVPRLTGDVARELFLAELVQHRPALTRAPAAPPPARPPLVFYFEKLIPRTTAAIVITLSAALLGTLLTTRVIVFDEARRAAPSPHLATMNAQSVPPLRAPSQRRHAPSRLPPWSASPRLPRPRRPGIRSDSARPVVVCAPIRRCGKSRFAAQLADARPAHAPRTR
jgi:hypothetical protein